MLNRRKRLGILRALVVLPVLSAVVLSGCQSEGGAGGSGESHRIELPEVFTTQVCLRLGTLQLEGEYRYSSAGEYGLEITSPQSLEGLELSIQDGELTSDYQGLSFIVGSSVKEEGSVMQMLQEAMECLNGIQFTVPAASGPYQLTLGQEEGTLQVIVDDENFLPLRVILQREDFLGAPMET